MIDFIVSNWVWIVAILLLVAMHRGGHGCGMHGRGGHRHEEGTADPESREEREEVARQADPHTSHHGRGPRR